MLWGSLLYAEDTNDLFKDIVVRVFTLCRGYRRSIQRHCCEGLYPMQRIQTIYSKTLLWGSLPYAKDTDDLFKDIVVRVFTLCRGYRRSIQRHCCEGLYPMQKIQTIYSKTLLWGSLPYAEDTDDLFKDDLFKDIVVRVFTLCRGYRRSIQRHCCEGLYPMQRIQTIYSKTLLWGSLPYAEDTDYSKTLLWGSLPYAEDTDDLFKDIVVRVFTLCRGYRRSIQRHCCEGLYPTQRIQTTYSKILLWGSLPYAEDTDDLFKDIVVRVFTLCRGYRRSIQRHCCEGLYPMQKIQTIYSKTLLWGSLPYAEDTDDLFRDIVVRVFTLCRGYRRSIQRHCCEGLYPMQKIQTIYSKTLLWGSLPYAEDTNDLFKDIVVRVFTLCRGYRRSIQRHCCEGLYSMQKIQTIYSKTLLWGSLPYAEDTDDLFKDIVVRVFTLCRRYRRSIQRHCCERLYPMLKIQTIYSKTFLWGSLPYAEDTDDLFKDIVVRVFTLCRGYRRSIQRHCCEGLYPMQKIQTIYSKTLLWGSLPYAADTDDLFKVIVVRVFTLCRGYRRSIQRHCCEGLYPMQRIQTIYSKTLLWGSLPYAEDTDDLFKDIVVRVFTLCRGYRQSIQSLISISILWICPKTRKGTISISRHISKRTDRIHTKSNRLD